jgi:hypothetical protein
VKGLDRFNDIAFIQSQIGTFFMQSGYLPTAGTSIVTPMQFIQIALIVESVSGDEMFVGLFEHQVISIIPVVSNETVMIHIPAMTPGNGKFYKKAIQRADNGIWLQMRY